MTAPRGTGTKRQRRPGVWEIRVAAGTDPVTGRAIQRSVTFHGTEADAETYRLRHNVATFLVGRGEILQAQARLGHRDAATTLREYSYALPGTDTDIADAIDRHLNRPSPETEPSHHDTAR